MADRAGAPALPEDLVDLTELIGAYYDLSPDPAVPEQRVAFGTSGHRGSSLKISFNEAHIAATSQAIADYRRAQGITGPLYLGKDTHALSEPAHNTALEVLAANDVAVLVDSRNDYTPTPAISLAISDHNRGLTAADGLADGIVVTPSHNPPQDGGFKYNPPHGGPAGSEATAWIADRANELLAAGLAGVRRVPLTQALQHAGSFDFLGQYVDALPQILDLEAIRSSGVRIGADPMGGASVSYWGEIAARHRLELTVINPVIDPQWAFMNLDWDGKIRMDPSSPAVMSALLEHAGAYDVAVANDADADRHGIVAPDAAGTRRLLNPNHYLAVAIDYLYQHRENWPASAAVGKTLVSSSMIDRVTGALDRRLLEVPVGFKWFVPGLSSGDCGFGGEESAGASFLRRGGSVWTTDKDGILLALLAAEITAVTGKSPAMRYEELTEQFGNPAYARVDAAATPAQKTALGKLSATDITADALAGEQITAKLTRAPGNDAAIDGLKVTTENAWFAARPSGTEDVYKIYAESFHGADHLRRVQDEARAIVDGVLG
ncbi:phosphoglucomutase (alpha-D-glucose-1,6-bisphosphate-dependent) [Acaricomes phytoseiuli]|uniref:phosphoglucomutase (alpha-D-glucose-1,6-bisphosphate-dependent) n=1 Tax=Acaricomes phytoseiuli TaxID=291968 RepID=UPI000373979F|nr:phosphoglucomutase (alpha-D-glucose-1,6-bisphosphate-dependent) [Acaricomes phytoseiuli]MCW1249701.1 phosphoglucomutase (alpha-D-glucose-1,6-bisphosphate-dependent) [Acaricomes phytoseiuli]